MTIGLTVKQAELLAYIETCAAEGVVAPSFMEMQEALGLSSKSGVFRLISALEERGFVRRLPGRARALELCSPVTDLSRASDAALLAEVARRGLLGSA